MRPILFQCDASIAQTAEAVCHSFADVSRWVDFQGWGPLPGIARAEYAHRTPEMIGSRIMVHNRDGSSHLEHIEQWELGELIVIRMDGFTAALRHLATHIVEVWHLSPIDSGVTAVQRRFELHPRSLLTKPALLLISVMLKHAVARHMSQLEQQVEQ